MTPTILRRLADVVGAAHVITDDDTLAGYLADWTGRWTGVADAVVRPRTTEEVAAVITLCAADGVSVCVQGGNTGLVGGSVPPAAGDSPTLVTIVLSTARMTDLGDVDATGRCVGAQAGATVAAIDRHAASHGLRFGIDLAARESATAGGVVATNAGGIRMIRHGNTRGQVLGIEAVLADGCILRRWSPLIKDNVGYDLPGLLAGSEGTLAVITEVLFALVTPPAATTVAVLAIDRVAATTELIAAASRRGLIVEAAEIMTAAGIDLVHEYGARRPVAEPAPFTFLIEVSGSGTVDEELFAAIEGIDGVRGAVAEPGPATALWAARETHTESIARSTTTPVVKLDVSVPIRALPEAFDRFTVVPADLGVQGRPILFGHVGDGNIHVNYLDVPCADEHRVTEAVFAVVADLGGSISAEHGIGRAKAAWIGLGRTDVDIVAMRTVKTALDPQNLLNPGVLFG
ncbi:FAD-binding oxidoreductase [Gordonia sp. (in: high G+C Gram-positive bacteria)]|uniref:FAD-binding oxidoreductase n=1 Tax=Gordonia sp. (in: high G+C Gram-positive bacteria) TaxID=84139 RepID=UPI001D74281C|nr:FAD-binding oxidoreductase [Gordonia sp. (in: high G+C Gram-positive bacteria)]MCB1293520.1 FAD-binding oxidoreductase [Gordonia sp. (in: high G+C Gram-positive bacteria)]HMS74106.1 FAD-binding oxidoreductase [Gordonia sp. (in: high G+C Gram-positive bacteria)]